MRFFLLIAFVICFLNADKEYDVENDSTIYKFYDYNSTQCYGSDSSLDKKVYHVKYTSGGAWYTNDPLPSGGYTFENTITVNGKYCSPLPEHSGSSIGSYFKLFYTSDKPSDGTYLKAYLNIVDISEEASCQETPDNNIINGLEYQGKSTDNSSCQTMYNDNGDGNGFQFVNLDLSGQCAGFCYYNLPDSTDTGNNTDNTDTSNNTDNTDTTNNTNNGTETDLSDLIPYLDEVEEKNQNIKDSLDTLNNNLNTQFNTINANNQTLDSTMNNLDTTLSNINNSLQNLNSNNDNTNEPDYSNVPNSLDINPDIDLELEGFKTDIENSLENSFSSYSNVFGLGGYGLAPAPITFNIFGKTYTIFDIKYLNPYIDHIRNIFLVTAYIFGLFLVFRGN